MIEFTSGNLLEADVDALVNTVNTVGVMGKGIALQFKQAFPDNYKAYQAGCKRGDVQLGKMFVVSRVARPLYIINFPTKKHWKSRSRLHDIEAGLQDLVAVIQEKQISSIAIPALGCKNGGLDWQDVCPLIEAALAEVPDVRALIYPPGSAPAAEHMQVQTKRPNMTPGRAAIISLMQQYLLSGYNTLDMLAIQKLAYFLQEIGEPLKLDFVKYHYGPYTETLQHVLQRIEGHYIRGYGDRSQTPSIRLLDGAAEEADAFLKTNPDTYQRLQRVTQLIEGFETPYGLELLATIHWLAYYENPAIQEDVEAAVQGVHAWSERKQRMFRPEHIRIAWEWLYDQGWINAENGLVRAT
jgi:O-acetyl-ADP-ribose deacetylase (regulator of RNase III)